MQFAPLFLGSGLSQQHSHQRGRSRRGPWTLTVPVGPALVQLCLEMTGIQSGGQTRLGPPVRPRDAQHTCDTARYTAAFTSLAFKRKPKTFMKTVHTKRTLTTRGSAGVSSAAEPLDTKLLRLQRSRTGRTETSEQKLTGGKRRQTSFTPLVAQSSS